MVHVVLPLMIAAALPYFLTLATKLRGFSRDDNRQTRAWQAQLTGWRQRAYWAHQNGFESFPLFAAARIVAFLGAPTSTTALAFGWAYPVLRVVYSALYVADKGNARSAVWSLSMVCIVGLFVTALA